MDPLAQRIEHYLLERTSWVPAADLCRHFDISQRRLRRLGDRPGLCSGYAISSDAGFKHIHCATTAEWLQFKHRIRRHGIGELVRLRDLQHRRHTVTRQIRRPAIEFEKDTGQAVLSQVLQPERTTPCAK